MESYFPYFDKELRKTEVTKELLWQKYYKHSDGYLLSQFRCWYQKRAKEASPLMHFTHKTGDMFLNFTGKKLSIVDRHTGEIQELEVFVYVLGSSQYTYVEAYESQKKEDLYIVRRTHFGFIRAYI